MTKFQKFIMREIALAQVASDSGKDLGFYHEKEATGHIAGSRRALKEGYACKPEHVLNAIEGINKSPFFGVTYFVHREADQNGYDSVLVYFCFKDGVVPGMGKAQISFHTPANKREAKALLKYADKGMRTHWDHVYGGSREAAIALAKFIQR